jgi:DNA topoisomerase-1
MIIYRFGSKDRWIYKDKDDKIIKDKKILDYIKSLPPIPPAYRNARIHYVKNPSIIFDGIDEKGRFQQIYSKKHREKADKNKFKLLIDFGKKMPQIVLKIQQNIKSSVLTKNKIIAIILRITNLCGFRIGQLKYQKLYNSTGMSTLMKKHLNFKGDKLEIKFIGKKGVLNSCVIIDKLIINEMKKISANKSPNDHLFSYRENGEAKLINAIDVNNWLKAYNEEFTTKLFRTFDSNVMLIDLLKDATPQKILSHRKKRIIEVLKEVSCVINNTPGICKKSYINPDLIDLYINHPKKYESAMINNSSSRINFIKFLEKNYS